MLWAYATNCMKSPFLGVGYAALHIFAVKSINTYTMSCANTILLFSRLMNLYSGSCTSRIRPFYISFLKQAYFYKFYLKRPSFTTFQRLQFLAMHAYKAPTCLMLFAKHLLSLLVTFTLLILKLKYNRMMKGTSSLN